MRSEPYQTQVRSMRNRNSYTDHIPLTRVAVLSGSQSVYVERPGESGTGACRVARPQQPLVEYDCRGETLSFEPPRDARVLCAAPRGSALCTRVWALLHSMVHVDTCFVTSALRMCLTGRTVWPISMSSANHLLVVRQDGSPKYARELQDTIPPVVTALEPGRRTPRLLDILRTRRAWFGRPLLRLVVRLCRTMSSLWRTSRSTSRHVTVP